MRAADKRPDMHVHDEQPYNAEPPSAALRQAVTPAADFYARNHGAVPDLPEETFLLEVSGLVHEPMTFTLAELRNRFASVRVAATLQCAGNRRQELLALDEIPGETPWFDGAISTAWFTGVRLRDVLQACGLQDACKHIEFIANDVAEVQPPQPYTGSVPVKTALGDDVVLAWGMNDEPLPDLHGGPLRVVVPGYIAARSVKWVQRVVARETPSDGYFQAVAYRMLPMGMDPTTPGLEELQLGPLPLNTVILSPQAGATVKRQAGLVAVHGFSLTGRDRRVSRVEVSGDGGATWVMATLGEQPGPHTWLHWGAQVPAAAGEAEIVARAWDDSGAVQPESPQSVRNAKGYANSCWPRRTVTVH